MPKDKSFSEIMSKPDEDQQYEILAQVHELAVHWEDKKGFSRETVCEGLLRAAMSLAQRRGDQQYFRTDNETRYFFLWASEYTKRQFETFTSYRMQWALDNRFGKDSLQLRDAKYSGWEENKD